MRIHTLIAILALAGLSIADSIAEGLLASAFG